MIGRNVLWILCECATSSPYGRYTAVGGGADICRFQKTAALKYCGACGVTGSATCIPSAAGGKKIVPGSLDRKVMEAEWETSESSST